MKRLFIVTLILTSCVGDLPDCETIQDVMTGSWVVKEVFIDNIKQEPESYGAFRLQLDPGGSYSRTQPTGFSDAGNWSVTGETSFLLEPNVSPAEQYILESFTLREMVIVLNRNSSKAGPSTIRYVLRPEKL